MTTPHPAELTKAERVRLRAEHYLWCSAYQCEAERCEHGRSCVECGIADPCPVKRLLDALEAAERERGMALDMHRVQFERANRIAAENQRLRALLSTSSVRGEGDG